MTVVQRPRVAARPVGAGLRLSGRLYDRVVGRQQDAGEVVRRDAGVRIPHGPVRHSAGKRTGIVLAERRLLQLNGADAIVFTAGTGENRADLRAAICANLENLGVKLDSAKNNATRATEAVISAADSAVKIFVIPTNEELVVAREAKRLLETK